MNRNLHALHTRLAAAATLIALGALTTLMPVRLGAAEAPPEAQSIAAARTALADNPEDAGKHLALARALGEAITANPANGPLHAFELRSALARSIELDPALVEAYHGLVGYFLIAPPIAGGSLDAAEATAQRLGAFDREAGLALLEQIAARRSDGHSPPSAGRE